MKITCKTCKKIQNTNGLDSRHIYCIAHTADEHERGIGLVCLNVRSINQFYGRYLTGMCPDCGRIVVETENRTVSFTVGANGIREDVIEL